MEGVRDVTQVPNSGPSVSTFLRPTARRHRREALQATLARLLCGKTMCNQPQASLSRVLAAKDQTGFWRHVRADISAVVLGTAALRCRPGML